MKKIIFLTILLTSSAFAYMNVSLDDAYEGMRSNSVIEIEYDSMGVWIGTANGASYRADGDTVWTTYTGESGLLSTQLSAIASSRYNDTTMVVLATLHTEYVSYQNVPYGDGFTIIRKGDWGEDWDTLSTPSYANYYGMLAYDLDLYQNDIYAACYYGGLVFSQDGGDNWDNLYLNEDDSTDLVDSTYSSYSNRYFSVKIDLTLYPDTVSIWGGSAAGLNRYVYTNYNSGGKQNGSWTIAHSESDLEGSLPGNHVVALGIQGDHPGRVYDVFVDSTLAYVAHDLEGLRIVDCSDSTSPEEIGSLDTGGRVWAVVVVDSLAYMANYDEGLYIADISDPTNPTHVGDVQAGSHAVNLRVIGNYAYVADNIFGLYIFDVSDPTNPIRIDSYQDNGGINDVDIFGNYAFLAADDEGLVIVNVANPDSMFFVGQYVDDTTGSAANEVTVQVVNSDTIAFVADGNSGVLAIDVSDPTTPTFIDNYDTPGPARSICYSGAKIYMTDEYDVREFDLASPTQGDSLLYYGSYGTDGTAINVDIYGSKAYVADNYFGMQIVDITDPENMALLGNYAPVCSTYIWAACRVGSGEDDQTYAVAYSPNYGDTWKTVYEGEAWDFAFKGDTVIIATDDGLYISDDYTNWTAITEMQEVDSVGEVIQQYYQSEFYAVEAVGSGIWAGGQDGTVYADLTGETSYDDLDWDVYRSQLDAEGYYAYPTPFSPIASTRHATTIHYMPPQTTDVTIKIYDFNLDLVATVIDGATRNGGVEADNDIWDGYNDKGQMVANGVYFFNIKLGTGEDWWGKVAVVK